MPEENRKGTEQDVRLAQAEKRVDEWREQVEQFREDLLTPPLVPLALYGRQAKAEMPSTLGRREEERLSETTRSELAKHCAKYPLEPRREYRDKNR